MIILIKQLCLCVSLFYNLSPPKGLAQFCRIKVSKLSRNIWIFPKVCFQEYIDYLHFSTIHVKAAYTKFHINYTVQVLNFLWTIASNHICWYSSLEFYFNLTPVFGNTKFSFCNPTNLWRRIFVLKLGSNLCVTREEHLLATINFFFKGCGTRDMPYLPGKIGARIEIFHSFHSFHFFSGVVHLKSQPFLQVALYCYLKPPFFPCEQRE